MKVKSVFLLLIVLWAVEGNSQIKIDLNGEWDFDQTIQSYPPAEFTRKIPVPGLVSLATPLIDDYEIFFRKPVKTEYKTNPDLLKMDYTPKYSWYRREIFIPDSLKGKNATLVLLKSQHMTQVFINGHDIGSSMSCFTPITLSLKTAVKYGAVNEILIKVGDKLWIPSQAAGGFDKEKEHYLPGIWDNVYLSFSDKFRIQKGLFLPSLSKKEVTAKFLLQSFYPLMTTYGKPKSDKCVVRITIYEKDSRKPVAAKVDSVNAKRDKQSFYETVIPMKSIHPWTPDNPFLYRAEVEVLDKGKVSDRGSFTFGMRDFERKGKHFYLNGEQIYLTGSNITLHRFFEDPESKALAWNRDWVKKMMVDYAKKLHWNTYRICVGLVPDFWYDLADEYGIMLQNEWMYWEDHGWNDQIKEEYSDWIWSDGNHPSIVIWDAINENRNDYIGSELIPQLKKVDPTRVWDAGYMTSKDMQEDEMDEPHPYMSYELRYWNGKKEPKEPYPLGNLDYMPKMIFDAVQSSQAQLINEYGWVWTWRDGQPSKLTLNFYKYYLGEDLTADKVRHFQAYWLQIDTEWLRCQRELAGVLSFTHLTNNYGYTGDWFTDIKTLKPSPVLDWFQHCFNPSALFINLTDGRFVKSTKPLTPGSLFSFNLVGINDLNRQYTGNYKVYLYNESGRIEGQNSGRITIPPFGKTYLPISLQIPKKSGGYTMVCELIKNNGTDQGNKNEIKPTISRRYLKVGNVQKYRYFEPLP